MEGVTLMKKKVIAILLFFIDAILVNLSFVIAFFIRFENLVLGEATPFFSTYIDNILLLTSIKLAVFYISGLYNRLWRYASIEEVVQIVTTSLFANATVATYMVLTQQMLPRSIYILTAMIDIFLIGGVRFSYRASKNIRDFSVIGKKNYKRVMIIGAGQAGAMVIKELRSHENLQSKPMAIIDDDPSKLRSRINGVPVLGNRNDITRIVTKKKIDEIIIAIPSGRKNDIRHIVEEANKTQCKLKIVPGIFELIGGQVTIEKIREVSIEDLLGRDSVDLDVESISEYIKNKVVLITGGGGSIGSELCRQIAVFEPKQLVILDIYENNAYDIQIELTRKHPHMRLDVIIASIRDKSRIKQIFNTYKPEVVFHAAAHKHVPLMEFNPEEAIKNNVLGTKNIAEAAHESGVKKFVMISTDKAVNPTNIMGATKRVGEMIIQSLDKVSDTGFVAVRFGNVLGSKGSVIPLFQQQIAEGGPVTVTHPDVIRYFMTIPEAAQLVIQAGAIENGGEIFVLDMGEPVKIIDLAKNLIRLSGFEPEVDIPINITGLRPGEKLYEELLLDGEALKVTKHEKIFVGKAMDIDLEQLNRDINNLRDMLDHGGEDDMKKFLMKLVPTYKPTDL